MKSGPLLLVVLAIIIASAAAPTLQRPGTVQGFSASSARIASPDIPSTTLSYDTSACTGVGSGTSIQVSGALSHTKDLLALLVSASGGGTVSATYAQGTAHGALTKVKTWGDSGAVYSNTLWLRGDVNGTVNVWANTSVAGNVAESWVAINAGGVPPQVDVYGQKYAAYATVANPLNLVVNVSQSGDFIWVPYDEGATGTTGPTMGTGYTGSCSLGFSTNYNVGSFYRTANLPCGAPCAANAALNLSTGQYPGATIVAFTPAPPPVATLSENTYKLTLLGDSHTYGGELFLNASVSGGTAPYTYSYTWLPPGCTSSNSASISCSPTGVVGTTYTPTVWVNDSIPQSSNAQANYCPSLCYVGVTIYTAIKATWSVPQPWVNQPDLMGASASGGQLVYTFRWTFGDGSKVSGSSTPTHTYNVSLATYTVQLWANDSSGVSKGGGVYHLTMSITVESGSGFAVSFAASSPSVQVGAPLTFWANTSGGVYPVLWSYSGVPGCAATGLNAAVSELNCTATVAGNWTETVWVNDSINEQATARLTVSVTGGPPPPPPVGGGCSTRFCGPPPPPTPAKPSWCSWDVLGGACAMGLWLPPVLLIGGIAILVVLGWLAVRRLTT